MRERILSKLNSIIVTLIFSIAIFVPFSIGIIEKDKEVSIIEKRKLSAFPKIEININDVKKFPKLFDTYYSDHFGLRDWLTEYYKLVKFSLGDSPSNDVTLGRDGWLFLGSIKKGYNKYSDPIGDVRNINLYSESDLKKFATYMVSLKAWLNKKGIEYVFVIVPNKHTIYFDKLPRYISKDNEYSSTDQLVGYLKSHTDISVVDLRKILKEKKNKYQLYYKTDTHWNHYAANIAQYEIMLKIEKLFPTLINPEFIKLKEGVRGGGDLASFIGVNSFNELNPQPIFKNSCEPVKFPEDAQAMKPHSFICKDQKLNAVIFRDSFFSTLQPYFSRKFKRSTYVWEKLTYPSLEKYVNAENPNIIIEEWIERSLPLVPKKTMLSYENNKRLFECGVKSIYENNFKHLRYNAPIRRMSDENKAIRMKSIGKDPIIHFPSLPFERNTQYVVHIEIKTSVNSILQLFYTNREVAGYPFSEKNSVRVDINAGDNDLYILLDYNKLGKRFRLDPISEIGEFEIKTIEIREIKNRLTKTCTRTK